VHTFLNKIVLDMQVQPWWRHVYLILYFCTKHLKAVSASPISAYPFEISFYHSTLICICIK